MKNRICSALLCAVMLIGVMATGAAAEEVLPPDPAITILVTKVTGSDTLEVSLKTNVPVQAVQAVLTYDSALLTPIQWDSVKTQIPVAPGDDWRTSSAIHTLGYGGASGKPALAYQSNVENSTEAHLYLGAETMAGTLPKETALVTVRFQYRSEADADAAANSVKLADASIAHTAPANYPQALLGADGGRYVQATTLPEGYKALAACVPLVEAGSSQLPAGGTVTGDHAITFFDWDGKVIDAIAAPADATDAVTTFVATEAVQKKLMEKPGYAFDQWLLVTQGKTGLTTANGTFTSNDVPLADTNPDIAKFSALSGSVLVQAAYKAKTAESDFESDLVNNGSTISTDKYYTISEPTYSRYGAADGTTGSYSLKFTVERKNGIYGVTRLREPAVIVTMTPAGTGVQNILSLVKLENTDSATYEIVPTKQIARVSYKVVDTYGVSNWPGCADKSDANVSKAANEFIQEGSRGFLAAQAFAVKGGGSWDSTVNAQAFADSFVNTTDATRKAVAWWTAERCEAAKSGLLAATTGAIQISNDAVGTALSTVT